MSEVMPLLPKFIEFETKYKTELVQLKQFKQISEALGPHTFQYVQGPDEYYIRDNSPFMRLRISQYPVDGHNHFIQLTSKTKVDTLATYNTIRTEVNLGLSGNDPDEIRTFLHMAGYRRDFKITKWCHIYYYQDATTVFYGTRREDQQDELHFIEIEVKEDTIHELTEQQARDVITKYEAAILPLGITAKNRIKRSLFDIFHKEDKVQI